MDFDRMADEMLSTFPLTTQRLLSTPSLMEDDEFFKDLPVAARGMAAQEQVSAAPGVSRRAFSNYSYSNSSVVDDKGQRVASTRRRYEDSNGRLKAIHRREMDGTTLTTTWMKEDANDPGKHESICSKGTPEDFEAKWKGTPFAIAQEKNEAAALEAEATEASQKP
jgi:hypothetical protein